MGVLSNNFAQIVPGAIISASYVSDIYDVFMGSEREDIILSGSLSVTGSIYGTLIGTASIANTASYAIFTDYVTISSSYADSAGTASVALNAQTASYVETSQTASYVLNAISSSYALTAVTASYSLGIPSFNLVNTIFVSPSGSDATGTIGDISKPYSTLIAARNAAQSGSLIYVFPGTWSFDNRNAAGNPFNNNMDTLLNLWKNNVNYYFSPGSKIILYNQTITGQDMSLFKPIPSQSGDTVNIYGALEFESMSEGLDTFNGRGIFFGYSSTLVPPTSSYNFNCQLKSMKSFAAELMLTEVGSSLITENINVECDYVYHGYIQGQSGTASTIISVGASTIQNVTLNFKNVEVPNSLVARPVTIRTNNSGSIYSINYDYINSREVALHSRQIAAGSVINLNVLTGIVGSGIYLLETSGNALINITGNFYSRSSTVTNFISIPTGESILNFNGTVFLENLSGAGKSLLSTAGTGVYNLNCDIIYSGSNTTTTMITATNGTTTFSGNVYGSYAGRMVRNTNGRVNIKNSYISSSVNGMTLFNNTATATQGTISLLNSAIFVSSSTDLINGQYLQTNILNSQIKNAGTANIISNTNANGSVQLHNSLLITSGSSTINITGAAPLVVSNTTSNTAVTASAIYGTITELTEANIL